MKNKTILIFVAIIMIASVSYVNAGRLDSPITDRECYGSELAPGIPVFFCMLTGTNTMEASFFTYEPMHEYYTPQLKEVNVTGGETQTLTVKKAMNVGTLTVTGSPSYLYVKHV